MKKILQFNAVRDVRLTAAAGDENNVRPFDMVAYSGGKLYVDGFSHPVIVDLGGVTVKAANGEADNLPVTLDHDDSRRVGHTDSVKVGFDQIMMAGRTSASTEARDEVVQSARDGYRWAASIEGLVREQQVVKAGQSRVINGQRHDGPFIHAKRFVLRKVSFVTSGGDEDNVVTLAAESGDQEMDPKFKAWLESKQFDPAQVEANESQSTFLMAMWKEEGTETLAAASAVTVTDDTAQTEDTAPDIGKELRAQAVQAAEHIAAIKTICGDDQELFAKALKENWSADKTALEQLRTEREQATPAIHVRDSQPNNGEVYEAALMASVGKLKEKDFSDDVLTESDRFKGFGLHALMHQCIRASGGYHSPGVVDNAFIEAAFEADQKLLKASSGFSTLSMSGILSNIANKTLLNAYENVDTVIQTISGDLSVSDFKTVTMYRFIGGGKLLPIGPDGEIKHTEFGEESYTNQVETYARMCALTREMQINDDLGAFMQIPSSFGRQAALTLEKQGFTVLGAAISGGAFFTSGRGNLVGTDVVLGDDGLTEARLLFDEQVDGNTSAPDGQSVGDPIMLNPQYLLVPPAHKDTAFRLMNSRELDVANRSNVANTALSLYGAVNPHANSYQIVSSPYFGDKHSIPGLTDTHWLIIATPDDSPLIQIARLRGQTAPVLESAQTDFNTLGMQWRTYMDFGISMMDYRAGVYSPGA